MFSEYLSIGEVLKPQGVHGQVKIRPDTDDPKRYYALHTVYLRHKNGYIPCPIEQVEVREDGFVYGVLQHAATRTEAEQQRGWQLFVDRAHAVPLSERQYYISDLLECRVENRQGALLGHILDVLQPGANDVYEIKTVDGKRLYLPVLPFVIVDVQVREGRVVVDESRFAEVAVFED